MIIQVKKMINNDSSYRKKRITDSDLINFKVWFNIHIAIIQVRKKNNKQLASIYVLIYSCW